MDISFHFKVVGELQSEDLWRELQFAKLNLMDTGNKVYVYGSATPSVLMEIIIICGHYGTIEGGEFICE